MTPKLTDPLAAELATLPQAQVPSHLASSVMARISRLEDRRPVPRTPQRASASSWSSWATALGGVLAAAALLLPEGNALSIDLSLPEPVRTTFQLLRMSAGATLLLATGLALYLVGLFGQGNPDRSR